MPNQAEKLFNDQELLQFDTWYSTDIMTYLVHDAKISDRLLRCVLLPYDEGEQSFANQLQQLVQLKNNLAASLCFLGLEPSTGVDTPHYVVGFVTEKNELIIINPMGESSHKGFYEALELAKKKAGINKIYVSRTILQRDPAGLVSCGPISVALLAYLSQRVLNTEILSALEKKLKMQHDCSYQLVDISSYLPDSLKCLSTLDVQSYREKLESLRRSHFQQLINKADDELGDLLNAPEQCLFRLLCLGNNKDERVNVLDLETDPESQIAYQQLQQTLAENEKDLSTQRSVDDEINAIEEKIMVPQGVNDIPIATLERLLDLCRTHASAQQKDSKIKPWSKRKTRACARNLLVD